MKEFADEFKRFWHRFVIIGVAALLVGSLINLAVINAALYSRGNWMADQDALMLDRFTGTEGKALIERIEKLELELGIEHEDSN